MDDTTPPEWLDAASLTLEETYNQLRRIHVYERLINPPTDDGNSGHDRDSEDEDPGKSHRLDGGEKGPVDEAKAQIETVHTQRAALWSRARHLSADSLRPLKLIHLPAELLRSVFDYFRAPQLPDIEELIYLQIMRHPIRAKHRKRIVQNARLVCRLFNEIASPLLFPYIDVSLDQESLDKVDRISKSPLLSPGVYGIKINLAYRPKELADNIVLFKDYLQRRLAKVESSCAKWVRYSSEGREEKKVFESATDNFKTICSAWDACINPQLNSNKAQEWDEYQQILKNGHEEYRKKHDEQFRIINEGTFVDVLLAAIARMPTSEALYIDDSMPPYFDIESPSLLNSKRELARHMPIPHEWSTIEKMEVGAKLLPARILLSLPIAMHKAGLHLKRLDIHCFPTKNNDDIMSPDQKHLQTPVWSQLKASCHELEAFTMRVSQDLADRNDRNNPYSKDNRAYMDNYLTAMLSSQNLSKIGLCIMVLARARRPAREVPPGIGDGSSYPLGHLLSRANWPQIKTLDLSHFCPSQDEVEKLFSGLGRGRLEAVSLFHIELRSGRWAHAVDILRDRMLPAGLSRREELDVMIEFYGGEFCVYSGESEDAELMDETESLCELVQKYVSWDPEVTENPLQSKITSDDG